jgi:hypothetical protein
MREAATGADPSRYHHLRQRYDVSMNASAASGPLGELLATGCLPADPVPWLLGSDEPFALWATLTGVLGRSADDPEVRDAHAAVLAHPDVRSLISELPTTLGEDADGHHSPLFLPNRLNLLADMGVTSGDDERIDSVLEALLERRDRSGRFRAPNATRPKPDAGSLLCDSNAITEVLLRFGLGEDVRVKRAVARLISDSDATPQGSGWCCVPEKRPLFRVGAPQSDVCPQITLEGLRVLARLPGSTRPADMLAIARTPLEVWRRRADERPYEFGHGYQFKTVKWPSFWYDVLAVVSALGRFPTLWSGPDARPEDIRSMAELAACLVAYNLDPDGRVVPHRVHRGYERFSFGRKTEPSAFATARLLSALTLVSHLAEQIAAIDVHALPSSRGSEESSVPLESGEPEPMACPVPLRRSYDSTRILPRVLARHHLDTSWEMQSPESITADLVGLNAGDPATPYLTLAGRLPNFDPASLDKALDHWRSLVRVRCMRGQMYVVRRDFVHVVHAANSKQVIRYAREFTSQRGVSAHDYEQLSVRVLDACAEKPMTKRELRERLRPSVDLAAVITLMSAERLLLQSAPADGRFGRQPTYVPFAQALPDVELDRLDQSDARPLLLRAYVRGFGPVTRRDAAWWAGMDLKRVRRSLAILEDELVEVTFDDAEDPWLMHAADAEELERSALLDVPNVALLPANDPLLIGYANRTRFIDDHLRSYVFDTSGNAAPVVLLDGRVIAAWDIDHGDSSAGREPAVLVFPMAPIDAEVAVRLEAKTRTLGAVRLGVEPVVRYVAGMHPLTSRPIGAFAHPLR